MYSKLGFHDFVVISEVTYLEKKAVLASLETIGTFKNITCKRLRRTSVLVFCNHLVRKLDKNHSHYLKF